PSPIFTRRSYEPAPSPGQLRVGEDLPAALGVFTQLGAVFGARRHSRGRWEGGGLRPLRLRAGRGLLGGCSIGSSFSCGRQRARRNAPRSSIPSRINASSAASI